MKRVSRAVGLVLCVAILLAVASCNGRSQDKGEQYDLYFLAADFETAAGGGALRTEGFTLEREVEDTRVLARLLMERLLEGPATEGLRSAIPAGTTLLSVDLQGRRAVVDLSASYGGLSGVALTLADSAITLTLTQLPDIFAVEITVQEREIAYRGQQIFTARDVLMTPEEDVLGTVDMTLYFLDSSGELVAQKRQADLYEGDTQVGAVLAALADGPEGKELFPIFPEGFRIRSAWQEDEVCYVNLSSALLGELGEDVTQTLEKALTAVGRSMCSLGSVSETRFLVDGEFAAYYGPVSVSEPYA